MRVTIEGIIAKLIGDEAKVQPDGESTLVSDVNTVLDECVQAIDDASCALDECPTEDSLQEVFSNLQGELSHYNQAKEEVEQAFHRMAGIVDDVQSAVDDLESNGSWDLDGIDKALVFSHLQDAKRHTETVRESVAEGVLGGFSVPTKALLDRTAKKAAGIVCDHLIGFLGDLRSSLNDE